MLFYLVHSVFPGANLKRGMPRPPVGLGCLAEVLRKRGVDYKVFDLGAGADPDELIRSTGRERPDCILVSSMSMNFTKTHLLLSSLKRASPKSILAFGGPHAASMPEVILSDTPVDLLVLGEGEPFLDLFFSGELSSCVRDRVVVIEEKIDPDSYPFPSYHGFNLRAYWFGDIPILTSRGCPYSCSFCNVSLIMGKRWRAKSPEKVVEEVQYWFERGRKIFTVVDDNFLLSKKRVKDIAALLEKAGLSGRVTFRLTNGVRADHLADPEVLEALKVMGVRRIAVGVESFSQKVLDAIGKKLSTSTIEKAVRMASEKFDLILFFVIGHPGETFRDFLESVRFALKYPVAEARFHNLVPFPETRLASEVKKHGRFLRKFPDYLNSYSQHVLEPVFETPEFPERERKVALEIGRAVGLETTALWLSRKTRLPAPVSRFIVRSSLWERLVGLSLFRKIL